MFQLHWTITSTYYLYTSEGARALALGKVGIECGVKVTGVAVFACVRVRSQKGAHVHLWISVRRRVSVSSCIAI